MSPRFDYTDKAMGTERIVDALDLIKKRRSIPRFTSDPVPREVIEEMLDAATWAPNHHLTEPWEFIVLEGNAKERFAAIRRDFRLTLFPDPSAPEVQKVARKIYEDALATPVIIVVTTHLAADPAVREDDYAATFCAIQNMLLVAASRGVGTYPRTGELIHDAKLRAFLSLPSDRRIAAVIYAGYPAVTPERRRTPWQQKTKWMKEGVPLAVSSGDRARSGAASGADHERAIDPVCKMDVEIATAEYMSTYNGITYYFCAPGCKAVFDESPAAYVSGAAQET